MNIFFNSRIYANQSLLNVLFGQQQKTTTSQSAGCSGTRDTLTISASGKKKMAKSISGRTHNTSIDSSIDLKSYIVSAKKTNKEIIDNAGTQINAKTGEYMSTGKAFREALTEKYSKLAAEAKTHSNPENYIHSKYFDKSSDYYETNLTDTERRIATVYKGNIIKNLIMDCQSYTKYRPNETTGGIFVSWRRKEELPTGA